MTDWILGGKIWQTRNAFSKCVKIAVIWNRPVLGIADNPIVSSFYYHFIVQKVQGSQYNFHLFILFVSLQQMKWMITNVNFVGVQPNGPAVRVVVVLTGFHCSSLSMQSNSRNLEYWALPKFWLLFKTLITVGCDYSANLNLSYTGQFRTIWNTRKLTPG